MTHRLLQATGTAPALGLWLGLANAYTAELSGTIGFDWALIDAEHAPNTLQTVVSQLQALSGCATTAVVRPPTSNPVDVKRYLDIGANTLLLPMIDDAEHAAAVVSATRYPPRGTRGVGSALARASRWGQDGPYLSTADERNFLIMQIETPRAVAAIDAIVTVDGVDAIFVGLSDLAATMGHLGEPMHPEVQDAFAHTVRRTHLAGKPAGTLAATPELAEAARQHGCQFVAVGTDVGLLTQGGTRLLAAHRPDREQVVAPALY